MASIGSSDLEPSLGIGRILSQSFSILFRRFVLFFAISFVVQLAVLLIVRLIVPTPDIANPADLSAFSSIGTFVGILLGLVATSVTTGIIVVAAYDAWLGNPSRPGAYIGAALAAIVPLVVLSIVTNIGFVLGFMLFVLPGLYLAAMWSCVTPAIVAEGMGFASLGRSAELTRNYRWSIIGLLIVVGLIVIGISLVLQAAVGSLMGVNALVPGPEQMAVATSLPYQLLNAAVGALTAAFMAIVTAVLFARLKEIKEGVGYEDLGSVFD